MCRTDIKKYFASIDVVLMCATFASWGCDQEALHQVKIILNSFQNRGTLRGLPVGPEASAISGNAFLRPVDQFLESRAGFLHARWMDDLYIFASSRRMCEALLTPLDDELATLGLERSIDKTRFFDSRQAAIDEIEDGALTSAFTALQRHRQRGIRRIHEMFDEDIRGCTNPNPTRFRAIIKTLMHSKDPYGARWLACAPEHMNVDPKVAAEYLGEVGLGDSQITDLLFTKLDQPAADDLDALDLHLIRALGKRAWGRVEGKIMSSIASNQTRRPPIRAWACHGSARAAGWRGSDAMDAAEAEADALVKRAMITAMKRTVASPQRKRFFRHIVKDHSELRCSVEWVES